jgi:hypothetical protein
MSSLMAPSSTQGAVMPVVRRPATRVVFHMLVGNQLRHDFPMPAQARAAIVAQAPGPEHDPQPADAATTARCADADPEPVGSLLAKGEGKTRLGGK